MNIKKLIRAEYWLETINDKDSYQKRLEELRDLVEKELDVILEFNNKENGNKNSIWRRWVFSL
jgi:hypothetical protein